MGSSFYRKKFSIRKDRFWVKYKKKFIRKILLIFDRKI